jgi:hypothetical protein
MSRRVLGFAWRRPRAPRPRPQAAKELGRLSSRVSTARPAGDRRRPLRQGLPADHQPSPVGRWHAVIGDMTLGDAILDCVVHRAHRIELKGASLRK